MDRTPINPNSEERILSAVSHAAVVIPYLGLLAPLTIWITQRDKSTWLRFQALQALAYQVLQFVILVLGSCLLVPLFTAAFIASPSNGDRMMGPVIIFSFLPYLLWALLILAGLFAGMLCALGRDFHYPLLGKWIKKYLEIQPQRGIGGEND